MSTYKQEGRNFGMQAGRKAPPPASQNFGVSLSKLDIVKLLTFPLRIALLDESGHALFLILGSE